MKKSFALLLFLVPLFSRAQQTDTTTRTKIGDTAPNFEFNLSKEHKASLKDYKGKIVMLNFFATWCPPCRAEMPRVQKEIWEKYRNNPKFALLAIDRQEGWDKLSPFKQSNNFTFAMVPDEDRKIFSLFATQSIPRNVVLDENGKIIFQSIGYDEADFNKLLALLAERLK